MAEAVVPVELIHPLLQDGPVGHVYKCGLIVVSAACVLTCLVCGWNIKRHCSNYNARAEQRIILSILYFPPVAAFCALCTYLTLNPHNSMDIVEVFREVSAVMGFICLIKAYMETDGTLDPKIEKEPANAGATLIVRKTLGAYIGIRYLTIAFWLRSFFNVFDLGQSDSALAIWAFYERYYDLLQLLSTTTMLYWLWSLCVQLQHSGKLGDRAPRVMSQFKALRWAVSGPMFFRYMCRVVVGSGALTPSPRATISEETFITACVECGAAIQFAMASVWMMWAYSAADYKENAVLAALGEGTNAKLSIWRKLADGLTTEKVKKTETQ